jgi:hypothetical protein
MKLNESSIVFIKSTLIVLLVSGTSALAGSIFGFNFWGVFLLSVVIQYMLFSFIGGIINSILSQKVKIKELEQLEQLSTILQCSSCTQNNIITFIPDENERVEFICESCKKTNVVNINFSVAGVTDPVAPLPKLEDIKDSEYEL